VNPLADPGPDPTRPSAPAPAPAPRPATAPRQEYQEFILQRIEEYKDTLGRAELLAIGDEAVRDLEAVGGEQYLLTEVLLLEHVDRIIQRRLRLPSFTRWRQQHRALREAQRQATHWGLDPAGPFARLARRLEPGDVTVVVGAAALPAALFLAAHEVDVLLLDQDLGGVESAEQRAVTEQLARRFHGLVVRFGGWLPDVAPALVALDATALAPTAARERTALIHDLQRCTVPGGVHVVLPPQPARSVIALTPESLRRLYEGWEVERRRRGAALVASKPRRTDTGPHV
jgi:CO/xanthine dehydrogenase FAD-binding subunit